MDMKNLNMNPDTSRSHSEPVYLCPRCKDVGFIIYEKDGYEYAEECECHKKANAKLDMANSGVPEEEYQAKSIERFQENTEEAKRMKEMALKYIKDKNALGIGYFGKSGTGKTHVCIAILNKMIENGFSAKYFQYRMEMQRLERFYFQESYADEIKKLIDVDVLYIDDLLKYAKSSKGEVLEQELRILYDIINGRYIAKRRTIFSSEYTVEDIRNKIDDALASRIYSMVKPYGMHCTGENRRMKDEF